MKKSKVNKKKKKNVKHGMQMGAAGFGTSHGLCHSYGKEDSYSSNEHEHGMMSGSLHGCGKK